MREVRSERDVLKAVERIVRDRCAAFVGASYRVELKLTALGMYIFQPKQA
jgi:hypothetical protein